MFRRDEEPLPPFDLPLASEKMRRFLVDLIALGLLVGIVEGLPLNASIVIGLAVPVIVGFARGYVEGQLLKRIPQWLSIMEWGVIVFAADILLCIPNSKSDPHDSFMTVFGAFFIVLIVPSIILSTISFAAGFAFARNRT